MLHDSGVIVDVSLRQTSDIRLKNEIASLNKNEHLDKLNKLIPKSYKFKMMIKLHLD